MSKALYDQIFAIPKLVMASNLSSMQILDAASAAQGNDNTRASDHAPIYIDLFDVASDEDGLRITGLLPNPAGNDRNNELVRITSNVDYRVTGTMTLRDESGGSYTQEVTIAPRGAVTIRPSFSLLSLNNDKDSVTLLLQGKVIDRVDYNKVVEGAWITF